MLNIPVTGRPLFFIRRQDRLASRLKALLNGWRFSRQVGGFTIFIWLPRDKSVNNVLPVQNYSPMLIWDLPQFYARRSDLFFMECNWTGMPFQSLADNDYDEYRPNDFKRSHFVGKSLTFLEHKKIPNYSFSGEKSADVRAELQSLFRELPLQSKVQIYLERARAQLGPRYTAVHVRRGDLIGVVRSSQDVMESGELTSALRNYLGYCVTRTAPYQFYYPSIDAALAEGERVAVFSDSPEAIDHFVQRYKSGNVVDGSRFSQNLREELQRAFVDFNLLSYATRLVGTSSLYFNMAATLGDAEVVEVARGSTTQQYEDYIIGDILADYNLSPLARSAISEIVAASVGEHQGKRKLLD